MRHKVTDNIINNMVDMYFSKENMSLREVGRKFNYSCNTVSYYFKQKNIKIKSKSQVLKDRRISIEHRTRMSIAGRKISINKQKEFIKLYNLGKSSNDISKIYNITGSTVRNYLKRNNIILRTISEANKGKEPKNLKWLHKHVIGQKRLSTAGANHCFWKGGRIKSSHGYIKILKPEHHRASKKGYVYEHILVMEEKLNRKLTRKDIVHHIDFDKSNNSHDNLYLFKSISEHNKYHSLLKQMVVNEVGMPIMSGCSMLSPAYEIEKHACQVIYFGDLE